MRIRVCLFLLFSLVQYQTAISNESADAASSPLGRIVEQKRAFYNQQFKEIQFVVLQGGENWTDDIDVLHLLLGYLPSNLCYEHPPDLRQELMEVSINRLINMLRTQTPCASLFKAHKPLGWRENICVISLDPGAVARDDRAATRFMFELDAAVVAQLPAEKRLPAEKFLRYLIDHEVFHCLDAFYNGPQPMSHEEQWGQYYDFRRENGADAFALAMHIKQVGRPDAFFQAIKAYRAMTVYHGDVDHWTYDAIRQVEEIPLAGLQQMTAEDVLHKASEIRDRLVGGYEDYLSFRATALQAMQRLHAGEVGEPSEAQSDVDPELLRRLMTVSSAISRANPHLTQ